MNPREKKVKRLFLIIIGSCILLAIIGNIIIFYLNKIMKIEMKIILQTIGIITIIAFPIMTIKLNKIMKKMNEE